MPLLDWFTKHRRVTISIFAILFILSLRVSITRNSYVSKSILTYFSDWSVALSALAALALLYVVYMTLLKTGEMRKEDRELDSKKRQLDEILKWTQDVRRELLVPRDWSGLGDYERMLHLESVAVGNDWAVMTAQAFGEDFQNTVRQATEDLRGYIWAWAQTPEAVGSRYDALTNSLKSVLDAVYRIRSKQKL